MSAEPQRISARGNPLLTRLRKLAQDAGAYRTLGSVWLEGDHLCAACLARGRIPAQAVLSESGWRDDRLRALAGAAPRIAVVDDALFAQISPLESAARIGFVLETGSLAEQARPGVPTVVLDRIQDPGNVGSILRSAAALGVPQVIVLRGTAALWSPKVLRAAMGAHFALHLVESAGLEQLEALALPLIATSPHAAESIADPGLPADCAWVLGHEGQGVAPELLARCGLVRRIPQPGGEESLNVAAAAAICFYESARRRS